jgi:RHS repeat-associated protein
MNRKRSTLLIGLVLILFICLTNELNAQEFRSPKRGYQSAAAYALSEIENINMTNGNLMLKIPLASLPEGRNGSPDFNLYAHYNSKLWDVKSSVGVARGGEDGTYTYDVNGIVSNDQGGWTLGIGYRLQLISRLNLEPQLHCDSGAYLIQKNAYIWKLNMIFPDGSIHEFRPSGYRDLFGDGYFNINPNGLVSQVSVTQANGDCSERYGTYYGSTSGMTYYSVDGSFMRLVVNHSGDGAFNPWTLYLPDGQKIVKDNSKQVIYDRNNNFIEIKQGSYGGVSGTQIVDQFGRSMIIDHKESNLNYTYIYTWGTNGEPLQTSIKWVTNRVYREYSICDLCPRDLRKKRINVGLSEIEEITLPSQTGSLTYKFTYNGSKERSTSPTNGFGEMSSITLPSGAAAKYQYQMDGNTEDTRFLDAFSIVKNHPTKKELTYLLEYDGENITKTDTWSYLFTDGYGEVFGPDGRAMTVRFKEVWPEHPSWDMGLVYRSYKDGIVTENVWAQNIPVGGRGPGAMNPFVKTEYISITDESGTPVKTAIKDYKYDKNGNVTNITEYDWVPYSSILRDQNGSITGMPADAKVKRITTNTYYNATPDSTDVTTNNPNTYPNPNTPQLLNAIASSEVSDGARTLSRTEYFYDNTSTTGNLTQQTVWDSSKGSSTNPLTSSNSITTSTQYDGYGNVTLVTDPKGIQTQYVYGTIGSANSLYPTEVTVALGKSEQRTTTTEYDYYTGAITRTTDVDNGVSTSTTYDALGRPTLVRTAENRPEETQVKTEYSDALRRVIIRRDLNTKGDGKLVTIEHYDQLGRIRLNRQLEDSSTQSAEDENSGIKVQTRYLDSAPNSYVLVSNPYRAAKSSDENGQSTMGWTRTKRDHRGRVIELQTFAGAALPSPWGNNGNSTGTVTTSYNLEKTTVTDQAGKIRESLSDVLGRLVTVIEAPGIYGYQTNYTYDGLDNLIEVKQGVQTRSFAYNSLSRLTSATNPESGSVNYQYDANGNLIKKTDAREIVTNYTYDSLNRVKTRSYSDNTPTVIYNYDDTNVANGKGKLASIISSVSTTYYDSYDALGRVLQSRQVTDGQTYGMSYTYDYASNLLTQTYPSGRVFTNTYDVAGRLNGVSGQKSGEVNKAYVSDITYALHGGMQSMKLGNGLWEHTNYNNRLQPTRRALGTSITDISKLQLNYGYGTTDNNGNVKEQIITIAGWGAVTQTYEYDALNRLEWAKEENGRNWQQTFDYDRYGNRRIDAANTTANVKPASIPTINQSNNRFNAGQGYEYDLAGNVTRDYLGNTYGYDGENKQVTYNGGGINGGSYFYDGNGNRIKKVAGQISTIFVYDAMGKMVAEYSNEDLQTGTSYLTTDHLGSTRAVTDGSGNVKERHDYLPFGEEIYAGIGGRSSTYGYGPDSVKQKFTQKERDNETGLDNFVTRYYSSSAGRFTSPDDFLNDSHVSDPQSWNLYTYVRNNPLRYIDPDGRVRRDKDGNVIFEKEKSEDVPFYTATFKGKDGKEYTLHITWKADKGYVYADDGTKITAYKATGEITTVIKDSEKNVIQQGGKELLGQITGLDTSNFSNTTDCHGTTFAGGQVWINNDQVAKLMKGDGYDVDHPTIHAIDGSVGIYSIDGTLKTAQHSVLVQAEPGGPLHQDRVISKGGITPKIVTTSNQGWNDPNARLLYYYKKVTK